MVDNSSVPVASGNETFANKDIAGVKYPRHIPVTPAGVDIDESAIIGALTETAPASDTASSGLNGRLQRVAQRITSLIALLPTALGAGGGLKVDGSGTALPVSGTVTANAGTNLNTSALALETTQSAGNTLTGAVTETAPASDTASSGLNGRLQRVAQRITSMITLWGAATDAKSTATDATSVTFMQVWKQVSASVQALAASIGNVTTGWLAVNLRNASGTEIAFNANGSTTDSASAPVAFSTEGKAQLGSLTETAPASDTASSGLNGRAQRIAQNVTSLISAIAGYIMNVQTANIVSGAITTAMTGTTSTSLVAAPGASLRNYITTLVVSNSHATVGTDVVIQDGSGGTTLMTIPAAAVYGGAVISLNPPLKQPTANTAIYCANVTTGASTKVSAVGFKGA